MTPVQLAAFVRRKTHTSSVTYPDADLMADANVLKDDIAGQIQQKRQEVFNVPTTDDLVINQREYAFPDDVMNNIVAVYLKFVTTDKYVLATPYSGSHKYKGSLDESEIVDHFSNTNPYYFIRRKAIYILSGTIPATVDGFLIVYNAFPADLAALDGTDDISVDPSDTTHGFPKEFHELWSRRISIEYKDRNEKKLSSRENKYEKDLEDKLDNFSTVNLGAEILASLPPDSTRGNNGYEY